MIKRISIIGGIICGLFFLLCIVLSNNSIQKSILESVLSDEKKTVTFDQVSIGILSTNISLSGAKVVFVDGEIFKINSFSAKRDSIFSFKNVFLENVDLTAGFVFCDKTSFDFSLKGSISTKKGEVANLLGKGQFNDLTSLKKDISFSLNYSPDHLIDRDSLGDFFCKLKSLDCSGSISGFTKEPIVLKIKKENASLSCLIKILEKPIFDFSGNVCVQKVVGKAKCELNNSQIEPSAFSFELPEFNIFSSAEFDVDLNDRKILVKSNYLSDLKNAKRIQKDLPDSFSIQGNLAFEYKKDEFLLDEFSYNIFDFSNEKPTKKNDYLVGKLNHSVAFLKNKNNIWQLKDEASSPEFFVEINDIPIAILNPIFNDYLKDTRFKIDGGIAKGKLNFASKKLGAFSFVSADPIQINHFSLCSGTERILDDVTVEIPLLIDISPDKLSFDLNKILVSNSQKNNFLSLGVNGEKKFSSDGHLKLNLDLNLLPDFFNQDFFKNIDIGFLKDKYAFEGKVETTIYNKVVEISNVSLSILKNESKQIFICKNNQPIRCDSSLAKCNFSGKTFDIVAQNFPLFLINVFFDKNLAFFGEIDGKLLVLFQEGIVKIVCDNPILINNFSMSLNGENKLLNELNLTTNTLTVQVRKENLDFFTDILISHGYLQDSREELATGDLKLNLKNSDVIYLDAKIKGNLAPLFRQKLFEKFAGIQGGEFYLTGVLDSLNKNNNISLVCDRLKVAGVVNSPIKSISCLLIEDLKTSSVSAELNLVGNDISNVKMNFSEFSLDKKVLKINGTGIAKNISIDDFQLLSAVFLKKEIQNVVSTSKKVLGSSIDEKPFWANVEGNLDLKIENLKRGDLSLKNIGVKTKINQYNLDTKIDFPDVMKGDLNLDAQLTFDVKRKQKYSLIGNMQGKGFESEVFFIETLNFKKSLMGGKFDMTGNVISSASESSDILKNGKYNIEFISQKGWMSLISGDSVALEKAAAVVEVGESVAGLIGGITKSISPKTSQSVFAFRDLQRYLTRFDYSTCSVKLAGNLKKMEVKNILLKNKDLMILGSGEADFLEDKSYFDYPFNFDFSFFVDKEFSQKMFLDKILPSDLIKFENYYRCVDFNLNGTLNKFSNNFLEILFGTNMKVFPNSQKIKKQLRGLNLF